MPPAYQCREIWAITAVPGRRGAPCVDFLHKSEYEGAMLFVRQFLAVSAGLPVLALVAGCKRGEPAKTLLLHDSGAPRPRRFDDVKILKTRPDYVKFRTESGEV